MRARPAETAGGLAGVATAVAALLGASTEAVAIVGTVAGFAPGLVTWLVGHGGVRGAVGALWRGRRAD